MDRVDGLTLSIDGWPIQAQVWCKTPQPEDGLFRMRYLTVPEAARRANRAEQTIRNHIARGWLKADRPTGARGQRLDEADLISAGLIRPAPATSAVSFDFAAMVAECGLPEHIVAGLAAADDKTIVLITAIVNEIVQRRAAQTSEKVMTA
jgi:hypothetical protein